MAKPLHRDGEAVKLARPQPLGVRQPGDMSPNRTVNGAGGASLIHTAGDLMGLGFGIFSDFCTYVMRHLGGETPA